MFIAFLFKDSFIFDEKVTAKGFVFAFKYVGGKLWLLRGDNINLNAPLLPIKI